MKTVLKEPLLHFLLIGAGLFLLFGWQDGPAPPAGGQPVMQDDRIIVAQSDIALLVDTFQRTWQRPPAEKEKKGLIESFIRDEIYYREARAMGLDRDDSVIRRRLRMKMEYIFEDISSQVDPTEKELLAYMKRNPGDYRQDPQVAFRQVYVNSDKRGMQAESHARRLLMDLKEGADYRTVGDPFVMKWDVRRSPLWDIRNLYGEQFAGAIAELEPGQWRGPIRSGYGQHLVYVTEFTPARLPELSEVLDRVKRDWAVDRQKKLKDAAYARLRERYKVEIEPPRKIETAGVTGAPDRAVTR